MSVKSVPGWIDHDESSIDIHFDVNGTMIAVDFADERNVTEEQTLQDVLADRITAVWESGKNEMTYTKHLETKYPMRSELKAKKQEELAQLFDRMKVLQHPELEKYRKVYETALQKLKDLKDEKSHVFPSVFRLLEELQKSKAKSTILIRTFGSEGPLVAKEISKKFPSIQFQELIDLREKEIQFPLRSLDGKGHQIIRDNYKPWGESGKKREYAKSFPVYDEPNRISIFLDDNIITDKEDCEIHNIVNPYDPKTEKPLAVSNILERCLFRVDTLEAIQNDEYFVEILKKALAPKNAMHKKIVL